MTNTYSPTKDFLRIRDKEKHRFFDERLGALMMYQHLTEQQCRLLLVRIDVELSMEFDVAPFTQEIYTRKVDEYVEELLNQPMDELRNLVARVEETIVIAN